MKIIHMEMLLFLFHKVVVFITFTTGQNKPL